MIQVTRKDAKESTENLLRRFNRKVQQAGILAKMKEDQNFKKQPSKKILRKKAIARAQRKEVKLKKLKLGIR